MQRPIHRGSHRSQSFQEGDLCEQKTTCACTYSCCRRSRRAKDINFRKTRLADAKGKQAEANLIFKESTKSIVVKVADRNVVEIPYGSIDKLTYDYSKQHRVKQGAIVMVASIGVEAVVMLTKSKSHWFTVDYHEEKVPKSLVLRLDKKEYKSVLETAKAQTGKDIDFIADAKLDKKKDDKK